MRIRAVIRKYVRRGWRGKWMGGAFSVRRRLLKEANALAPDPLFKEGDVSSSNDVVVQELGTISTAKTRRGARLFVGVRLILSHLS
jgi:hypothetical protein